jgi:hypothetical protein
VTHNNDVAACQTADLTDHGELDGEAFLIDIKNNAAWGYRAVRHNTQDYAFTSSDDRLQQLGNSFFENTEIFPPALGFSTRYFITPLWMQSNLTGACPSNSDMTQVLPTFCQKRTTFGLRSWPVASGYGTYDRNENFTSGGAPVHIRCVAGLDVRTLAGDAVFFAPPFQAEGGWAIADLLPPSPILAEGETVGSISSSEFPAFVYDLKFGNPPASWGVVATGMFNDAKIIRTRTVLPLPRVTFDTP